MEDQEFQLRSNRGFNLVEEFRQNWASLFEVGLADLYRRQQRQTGIKWFLSNPPILQQETTLSLRSFENAYPAESVELSLLHQACLSIGQQLGSTVSEEARTNMLYFFDVEKNQEGAKWEALLNTWNRDMNSRFHQEDLAEFEFHMMSLRVLVGDFALLAILQYYLEYRFPPTDPRFQGIRQGISEICARLDDLLYYADFPLRFPEQYNYLRNADFSAGWKNQYLLGLDPVLQREREPSPDAVSSGALISNARRSSNLRRLSSHVSQSSTFQRPTTRPIFEAEVANERRSGPQPLWLKGAISWMSLKISIKGNINYATIYLISSITAIISACFLFKSIYTKDMCGSASNGIGSGFWSSLFQACQFLHGLALFVYDTSRRKDSRTHVQNPVFRALFFLACICGMMSPFVGLKSFIAANVLVFIANLGQGYANLILFSGEDPNGSPDEEHDSEFLMETFMERSR